MARKIFQAISDDTHTYAVIETAGGGGGQYRHPVKLSTIKVENDDIQTLSSARILGNAKVDVIESWDVDSRSTGPKSNYSKTLEAMLGELPRHVQGDVLHNTAMVANPEADFQSTLDDIASGLNPQEFTIEALHKGNWEPVDEGNFATGEEAEAAMEGLESNLGWRGMRIVEPDGSIYAESATLAVDAALQLNLCDGERLVLDEAYSNDCDVDDYYDELRKAAFDHYYDGETDEDEWIEDAWANSYDDYKQYLQTWKDHPDQMLKARDPDAYDRKLELERAESKRDALAEIADQHRPTATLTKHAAQQACERADHDGSTEISAGVYLNSRESIQEEQAQWNDGDGAKHVDFSQAPYWLTTDDGQEPVAITGADDQELLDTVSVDERVASYAQEIAVASTPATLSPGHRQEVLASVQQVQAKRQAYGRAM